MHEKEINSYYLTDKLLHFHQQQTCPICKKKLSDRLATIPYMHGNRKIRVKVHYTCLYANNEPKFRNFL